MGSVLSLDTSDQYLTDTALASATREGIDAHLASLSSASAKELHASVATLLPRVSAQIDTISRELKSVGLVLSDTMNYAKGFTQETGDISFDNISALLTKSGALPAASLSTQQVFQSGNFELIKHYNFKKSLAEFYSKYAAHLQARRERLTAELKTMLDVHDNLTMIQAAAEKRL